MDAANTATPSSEGCKLLNLPIEIQAKIISDLPAKNIQLCRRVCKHFHNIIDEESNATLLFGRAQTRERLRISKDLANATDFAGVDFLAALARWLNRRGIWAEERPFRSVAMAFAIHWSKEADLVAESRPGEESRKEIFAYLGWLVEALMLLHTTIHTDLIVAAKFTTMVGASIANVQDLLECTLHTLRNSEEIFRRCGITESQIRERGTRIENSSSCLSAPIARADSLPFALRFPDWVLIRLHGFRFTDPVHEDDTRAHEEDQDGIVEPEWLSQSLEIDEISLSCCYFFTYCTRTEWAYNKLDRAFMLGEPMSGLEKTAVLEDILLF